MGRPRKIKIVNFEPGVTYFKPKAVPLNELGEVELTYDELETLRLSNLKNLNQIDAASKMHIHQSTFQRTLTRAREKVTEALVNGKAIKIHGGEYKMPRMNGTGPTGAGRGQGIGRGMGAGRGAGYGGPTNCKCSKCGKEVPHIRGQPCVNQKCPECGSMMVRGDI